MPTQALTSPIPPDQAFRTTWESAEQNAVLAFAREVAANWPGDADNIVLDPGVVPGTTSNNLEQALVEMYSSLNTAITNALAAHSVIDSHAMYTTLADHALIDHSGIPGVGVGGPGGGVTDHGALTGLADDDHTMYHTDARAATWLASTPVNAAFLQGNAASAFATSSHNHTASAITDFSSQVTATVNTLGRDDVVWAGGATPNNADGRQNGSWTLTTAGNSIAFWEKVSGTYVSRFNIVDVTSSGSGGGGGEDPRIPDGTSGLNNVGVPVWQNASATFAIQRLDLADLSDWNQSGAAANARAIWNSTSSQLQLVANPIGETRMVRYDGTNWIVCGLGTTVQRGDAGRTTPYIWQVDTNDPDPTANAGLMIDHDLAFAAQGAIV